MTRAKYQALLDPRWRHPVFAIRSREYDWIDVFLFAMLSEDWAAFEQQLIAGVACREAAAAAGAWPSEERINQAAARFRYDRGLLTTEEAHAWLDRHQLTADEWVEYLVRELLRHDSHLDVGAAVARYGCSVDLDPVFAADGVCSGCFHDFATTLAGHVAVIAAHIPSGSGDLRGLDEQVARVRSEQCRWVGGLDPADVTRRLVHAGAVESLFAQEAAAAVTDDALASAFARHRVDWMRVHLERISFASIDAAREAVCSVREDGLTLRDVSVVSRQPLRSGAELLERLDPNVRDAALSAAVGDLIGPISMGDAFEVGFVAGKVVAQLNDPVVRERAKQDVLDQLVSRAVLAELRWID